jgi:hypothetical protein
VSTAIGAGVASLILSCCHYVGNARPNMSAWKQNAVEYFYSKMRAEGGQNYVMLRRFCGAVTSETTFDVDERIKSYFGVDYMKSLPPPQ